MTAALPSNLSTKPAKRRKLGRHHFAFFRGYLEGIPLEELGERYLPDYSHLKVAKSTLGWIQDELALLARRNGKPTLRRLAHMEIKRPATLEPATAVPLPAEAGVGGRKPLPSLEQWAEEEGLDDFYTHRELVERYTIAFSEILAEPPEHQVKSTGSTAPKDYLRLLTRNNRLRKKQRDFVFWLEALSNAEPLPADPVAAWLERGLAARLAGAGVRTLHELIELIKSNGPRWHTQVPRLGQVGASRLVNWIRTTPSLGALPSRYVESPRKAGRSTTPPSAAKELSSPLASAGDHTAHVSTAVRGQNEPSVPTSEKPKIAPLERLAWPDWVQPTCELPCAGARVHQNDIELVTGWLARIGNADTARAARAQAERLLLWALFEKRRTIMTLSTEDLEEFSEFLAAPGADWICRRGTWRWSDEWRPFYGPLARSSIKTAIGYVRLLLAWAGQNSSMSH